MRPGGMGMQHEEPLFLEIVPTSPTDRARLGSGLINCQAFCNSVLLTQEVRYEYRLMQF